MEYIVACPLARGTMGYQGIAEQDVYDVMAEVGPEQFVYLDRRKFLAAAPAAFLKNSLRSAIPSLRLTPQADRVTSRPKNSRRRSILLRQ